MRHGALPLNLNAARVLRVGRGAFVAFAHFAIHTARGSLNLTNSWRSDTNAAESLILL